MNRKELYKNTTQMLTEAYKNEQLEHGSCSRCAVGNIVGVGYWTNYFISVFNTKEKIVKQRIKQYNMFDQDVFNCGYTLQELSQIEYAFESSIANLSYPQNCNFGSYYYYNFLERKTGQYIGLVAVLKQLEKIHNIDGSPEKEALKMQAKKFGIHTQSIQVATEN